MAEIITRFNISDKVWYIADGYIANRKIDEIEVKVQYHSNFGSPCTPRTSIKYRLLGDYVLEEKVYATKQELIDSIK